MKTFLVIPAYNESKNISSVINTLSQLFSKKQILVVDDGSKDNTYQVAKETNKATVLKHIVNRGQGAALQTGNQYALLKGADIIVHFDSDGQHRVDQVEKLIDPIAKKEADIVFGY